MIRYVTGDILKSDCQYIVQQVNCRGVMGAGLAKQIADKWPSVRENYIEILSEEPKSLLGQVDFVTVEKNKIIANLFAQDGFGHNGRYTNYEAFYQCLLRLFAQTPSDTTIAIPYKIGCGLGGANWDIIIEMIKDVFSDSTTKIVKIYSLEDI